MLLADLVCFWFASGLEHFFMELYHSLQAGLPVGNSLLFGMEQMGTPNKVQARVSRPTKCDLVAQCVTKSDIYIDEG